MNTNRQPKGSPIGGQFAPGGRDESADVELGHTPPTMSMSEALGAAGDNASMLNAMARESAPGVEPDQARKFAAEAVEMSPSQREDALRQLQAQTDAAYAERVISNRTPESVTISDFRSGIDHYQDAYEDGGPEGLRALVTTAGSHCTPSERAEYETKMRSYLDAIEANWNGNDSELDDEAMDYFMGGEADADLSREARYERESALDDETRIRKGLVGMLENEVTSMRHRNYKRRQAASA